ncbi:MAG: prolipoprotein diacylglyceryl transferase [Clostridia bacterium]|nr:prolipoprotein diacylglyceryl transferase [Clostridia bacterium]
MYSDPIFFGANLYGISIAVGILACFIVLFSYCKVKKFNEQFVDFTFYNGIVAIGVGFLTAQLLHTFYIYLATGHFNFPTGFSFLGGLLGGVISFIVGYLIFRKKLKQSIFDLTPVASCCILIAHAFGRIGCFFAGCCHGKETDSFLGVKFPDLPNPVHPTQLYEAAFLFALFIIFSILYLKKNDKYIICHYLISYGVFRFFIEFLRDDNKGKFIGNITPSQTWSIVMVVIGIALYFVIHYMYKNVIKKRNTQESVQLATETEIAETNEN